MTIDAPGAEIWSFDVETVAKSERGLDRTTQGTSHVIRVPVRQQALTLTLRPAARR